METTEKIAVITGAGSGIGRASALALYADGFSVVLAGRRREMLEETAALAKATPPRMLVVPTDVTDPVSVASLFDTVKTTYGDVQVKVGKLNGKVVQAAPEFESCRKLAEQAGVALKAVYEAACQAFNLED